MHNSPNMIISKEAMRSLEINDKHVLGKLWKILSALYVEYHSQKYNFSFHQYVSKVKIYYLHTKLNVWSGFTRQSQRIFSKAFIVDMIPHTFIDIQNSNNSIYIFFQVSVL